MMLLPMPKSDSDTINDAYGDIVANIFANLYDAYSTEAAPNPAAEKKFATNLKVARQARDKAIAMVSAP